MYAIIDEQSNCSLASTEASGYIVESLDKSVSLHLPTLLECNQIPNIRSEIPTQDAARHFSHLRDIAHEIPSLDPDANILLLLGRDLIRVHKVRQQIDGPPNASCPTHNGQRVLPR